MPQTTPPFPTGRPPCFRATVHGTVFAGRDRHLADVRDGDPIRLIADPPGPRSPEVWVHLPSGDPIGHLPGEISEWLGPWIQRGGVAEARVLRVRGEAAPSWRRVVLEVVCRTVAGGAP